MIDFVVFYLIRKQNEKKSSLKLNHFENKREDICKIYQKNESKSTSELHTLLKD